MSGKRKLFVVLLLFLVLLLQGCGGGGGGGNKAPKITSTIPAGKTLTVIPGQVVDFSVTAKDDDGDALSYLWEASKGTLDAGNTSTAKWTAPSTAGSATVKVTVADGKGGTASHTWTITIGSVQPPRILNPKPESSPTQRAEVNINEEIILSIQTNDPQGLPLESEWTCTRGTIENPQLNTAKWKAPGTTGPAQVTVKVTNSAGVSSSHTWYFTVKGSIVYVREDITGTVTWVAGNIYVIDQHDIYVRGTLTINAGAVVKFGDGLSLLTRDSGRISAQGSAESPVVFTSLHDDLWGGDTNGNQDATTPEPGVWGSVYLGTRSGNKFEYCHFYYGGGGWMDGMLDLGSSSGTSVKNCTFAFAEGFALYAVEAEKVTIEGNTFYLNEKPLAINVSTSLDDSNTFHNPQAPSEQNTYQGIFVQPRPTSTFTQSISWAESEAAFVLEDYQWYIDDSGKLTLGPGVTVKLPASADMAVRTNLEAKGEAGRPVVFTSIHDSTYGGDSSGPAPDDPQRGDWNSILIENEARATFEHCVIAYGGGGESLSDGWAALRVYDNSNAVTIKNTLFKDNNRALDLMSPKGTIENCRFERNLYPLKVDVNIDTDNSLVIVDNDYNAIYVDSERWSLFTRQSVEWLHTGVPYVLLSGLYLEQTTIQLGTGTILRAYQDVDIDVSNLSRLQGFANAYFTSYRDTQRGGNVGWPGPAAKGDWEGIWDDSQLKYVSAPNVLYARYPE